MSLHDLSAELLHAICDFCSQDSLQDLRLTCRDLREIADEHFFPEVVTCLERKDLANVRKIAKCSGAIRKTITRFTFQADRFDADIDENHDSRREWFQKRNFLITLKTQLTELQAQLDQRRPARHRVKHHRALAYFLAQSQAQGTDKYLLKQNYQTYKQMFEDQYDLFERPAERLLHWPPQMLREPNTIRDTFDKLFQACPNISAITINHKHTLRRNAGLSNLAFLKSTTIPHGGDIEDVVEHLLPAACDADLKIQDLAIAGASPYWMMTESPAGLGGPSPRAKTVVKYYKVLQHVKRLQLTFNGADANEEDFDPNVQGGFYFVTDTFAEGVLINWLKNCPVVQELRLVMPVAPFVNWSVEFKHILGQLHLENLTLLQISGFQAEPEDIVQSLLRHKDTLQELEMDSAHLTAGEWPECISAFAGKLPRLRRARLDGKLTSGGDDATEIASCFLSRSQARRHQAELEKYILEGTGPMPTWPQANSSDDEEEDEGENDGDDDDDDDDDDADDIEDMNGEIDAEDEDSDDASVDGILVGGLGQNWEDREFQESQDDEGDGNDELDSNSTTDDEQEQLPPLPTGDEVSSWSLQYLVMR